MRIGRPPRRRQRPHEIEFIDDDWMRYTYPLNAKGSLIYRDGEVQVECTRSEFPMNICTDTSPLGTPVVDLSPPSAISHETKPESEEDNMTTSDPNNYTLFNCPDFLSDDWYDSDL